MVLNRGKLFGAFLATIMFIFLLIIIYLINVYYWNVNVVFYSVILDVIIATLLGGLVLIFSNLSNMLSNFEKCQLILIWFLGGYCFAITFPTVIDRSLSFYILEKLQQRGGGIKIEGFENVFTKEYIKEHHLMEIRLTEQIESGTIIIEDGCIKLTKKGNQIATFSRFFRKYFLPKKRLIMGEYTDVLTDPFRGNENVFQYQCE